MMKNRQGIEYWFEEVRPGVHVIRGDLKYWRFGGREGESGVNMDDLGFVDPSGGPFISIGSEIQGRKVCRIWTQTQWVTPFRKEQQIFFEVES